MTEKEKEHTEGETERKTLRKRILEEMTVDYSRVLEQNLDSAKQLVRLRENGEVEVLVAEKLTGQEKILLYLIGKLYAKEAGLTTTDEVGNSELIENLGVPSGSLLPWLKALRDDNRIKQTERDRHSYHFIPINQVDKTLKEIMSKLQPSLSKDALKHDKSQETPRGFDVFKSPFGGENQS